LVRAPWHEAKNASLVVGAAIREIKMRGMNYHGRNHHEAASKFIGQQYFRTK
jgi:hypothetical protein